jgi:sarcosine oxidase subunit gamma
MPDIRSPLAAHYSVGRYPADCAPGVTFRERAGHDLRQIACWRGRAAALADTVERTLGVAPPDAPNRHREANGIELMTVAPNRLWCLAERGDPRLDELTASLDPEIGCTTELGHSQIRLRIRGPATRPLLAQEIALDLAPDAFPAGAIARTAFHHVPVLLSCVAADNDGVFDLFLPHTFAASAWDYLLDLASAHGYAIEAPTGHTDATG